MAGDHAYSEEDLRAAEEAVLNGTSQRKAAKENGIRLSTLRRYLSTEYHEDHRGKTKITHEQEQHIVDWILKQDPNTRFMTPVGEDDEEEVEDVVLAPSRRSGRARVPTKRALEVDAGGE